MIVSMTGFGTARKTSKYFDIEFNFKSVNNRFFDLNMKLPNYMSKIENELHNTIKELCIRGSIQVYCKIKFNDEKLSLPNVSKDKLNNYFKSLSLIDKKVDSSNFNINLQLDNLLNTVSENVDKDKVLIKYKKEIINTFNEALKDLKNSRIQEGKKISKDIKINKNNLKKILINLNNLQNKNKNNQFNKLKDRIFSILEENKFKLDELNMYKELAIYSDKYDISEEVVRLNCHLEQFEFILKNEIYPGKKINFLCQEFFREINTIGSKANNEEISFLVVDFKTSLEKIREQVQNIL